MKSFVSILLLLAVVATVTPSVSSTPIQSLNPLIVGVLDNATSTTTTHTFTANTTVTSTSTSVGTFVYSIVTSTSLTVTNTFSSNTTSVSTIIVPHIQVEWLTSDVLTIIDGLMAVFFAFAVIVLLYARRKHNGHTPPKTYGKYK